jgi:hypothetical protein
MTPSVPCLGKLELLVAEVGDELEGIAEGGDEAAQLGPVRQARISTSQGWFHFCVVNFVRGGITRRNAEVIPSQ